MSFYTRLRDPTLGRLRSEVSYSRILKDYNPNQPREPKGSPIGGRFASGTPEGGGSGQYEVPYERGNYAPSQPKETTDPTALQAKLDGVMGKIMAGGDHNLEHRVPWAKEKPEGSGINTSGIVKVDDEKYFFKMQQRSEADSEKGAWEAAQVLGWNDMARPTSIHIREGEYIHPQRDGVVVNPLLPEGESLMTARDGDVIKRVDSSDVNVSRDKLERMMVFEYTIGAVDRHGGNYWKDHKTGDLHGIDYARSFMAYSDAEETFQSVGASDEAGGIWDRSFNPDRTVAREHLQKVVDNQEKLLATVPPNGGFRTRHETSVATMRARINTIKRVLSANAGSRVDMRAAHVWR